MAPEGFPLRNGRPAQAGPNGAAAASAARQEPACHGRRERRLGAEFVAWWKASQRSKNQGMSRLGCAGRGGEEGGYGTCISQPAFLWPAGNSAGIGKMMGLDSKSSMRWGSPGFWGADPLSAFALRLRSTPSRDH